MRDQIAEALRDSAADYAEIRIERAEHTSLGFRGPELDYISSSTSLGGVARALVRGGWGVVTFNDLADLPSRLRDAVVCARLVGKEKSQLADVAPVEKVIPPPKMERDFRGVPLAEKQRVAKAYNDLMLGLHPKIHTTYAGYGDHYRAVYFANSEGSYFQETRPDVTLYFNAVAREGNLVQNAREGFGRAAGFEAALGLEQKAEAAARRTTSPILMARR
jgi:TldD protein